jgi:hypothetical protein
LTRQAARIRLGHDRWLSRHEPDLRDESVAPLRNRLDVWMGLILTKGFPELGDVPRETALFDKGVGPHRLKQIFAVDDMTRLGDQYVQSVSCFRGERDYLPFEQKQPIAFIEPEWPELKDFPLRNR